MSAAPRQPDLFNAPTDSGRTNTGATRDVARRRILRLLVEHRATLGATDLDIQETLNMPGDTERPRRGELEALGLIHSSGKRETPRGGQAAVWYPTPKGRAALYG